MKYGVVVIAASAGGVVAVGNLLSGLPVTFQVPILIVQHRSTVPSVLENVFRHDAPMPVVEVMGGNTLAAGTVFVAPADHHLLLDTTGVLRLSCSAKVHHVRPAADPLFVSVADFYRERTIADMRLAFANVRVPSSFMIILSGASRHPYSPRNTCSSLRCIGWPRTITLHAPSSHCRSLRSTVWRILVLNGISAYVRLFRVPA